MDLQLAGAAALVTGGGRGIGREIALCLAHEGVDVAVCGRTAEPLQRTAADIRLLGVQSAAIVVDLTDPESGTEAVRQTTAALGRLDILVNNASTDVTGHHPTDLEDLSDEQLLDRVSVKGVGAVRCTRAALPYLRGTGRGRVICIGGINSRIAPSGNLAVGLGNSFVAYFSKSLSVDVARDGVTVNVVSPGQTRTDRHPARMERTASELGISVVEAEARRAAQVPIGRIIEPIDVARVVVFLASPLSSAITGQVIAVDGGITPSVVY